MSTTFALKNVSSTFTLLLCASVLSACGGGNSASPTSTDSTSLSSNTNQNGSGNTVIPPVPNPPSNPPTPTCTNGASNYPVCSFPIYTTVPAATYQSNSAEMAFFQAINTMRSQAGLGLYAQNSAVDRAAQAHADYLRLNLTAAMGGIDPSTGVLYAHSEDVGQPGFIGALPTDRVTYEGYKGFASEVALISVKDFPFIIPDTSAVGLDAFDELMRTVYHREGMMNDQFQDIGIGYATPSNLVVDLAARGKLDGLTPGQLAIYPADGTIDAYPAFEPGTEMPNPLSDLSTIPAVVGGPITVNVGFQNTLAVSTFQLINNSTGAIVNSRLYTRSSDHNQITGASFAHLLPMNPLDLDASYSVLINGTINGKTFSKNWSFKTPKPLCQLRSTLPSIIHPGDSITFSFNVPSNHPISTTSAIGFNNFHVDIAGTKSIIVTVPNPVQLAPSGNFLTLHVIDKFYPNAQALDLRIPVSN